MSRAELKHQLRIAEDLAAAGEGAAAEALLQDLERSELAAFAGPKLASGVPRKIHSARLRIAKRAGDSLRRAGLQMLAVPPAADLERLLPFDPELRRAQLAAASHPVPRVLHQIWIGDRPIPETCRIWEAYALGHGWSYRLWDAAQLEELGLSADPCWREMLSRGDLPGAVDVARYHVLAEAGGLYLDCDWLPVAGALPPEAFLPGAGLSLLAEPVARALPGGSLLLSNALIAAPPSHPAMRAVLELIPRMIAAWPEGPAWWLSGPLALSLVVRQGPVTVLDPALTGPALSAGCDAESRRELSRNAAGVGAMLLPWKPWAAAG